jgi:predicted AAA+ superfamily ATPase
LSPIRKVIFKENRTLSEVYYHKNKQEYEFIVSKEGKITEAFQVCQSKDKADARSRKINGLQGSHSAIWFETGVIFTSEADNISS